MSIYLLLRKSLNWRWVTPLAVVLLTLSLRLYHIGHESVGHDEAFTLTLIRLPMSQMIEKIVQDIVHPPLHYFVLRGWLSLSGFGVIQARLLSTIFGTLAVLIVYVLASYLFDRRTALLSSLLLAVSQLGIMFSQEARPYAMLLFFFLCSCYLFAVSLREKRFLLWWGFVCSAVLMIYIHYWGLFVVASLVCYAILYRKRYSLPASWWIGAGVLGLALFLPWMAGGVVQQALVNPKTLPAEQGSWFAVHWWTPISAINAFNNGKVAGLLEPAPLWTIFLGGLLFSVPVLQALKPLVPGLRSGLSKPAEREAVVLVAILWALPLLSIIGLGALKVQYNVRYVAFCAAPYYILAARGIMGLKPAWSRGVLVGLLLAYSAFSLRANYFIPWKENFRDAVAYVLSEYKEGDCCIFTPFWEGVPPQWAITQGNRPTPKTTTIDAVASGSVPCGRVWLIVSTFGGNPWVKSWKEMAESRLAITHSKVEQRRYFWLEVELYSLKKQ